LIGALRVPHAKPLALPQLEFSFPLPLPLFLSLSLSLSLALCVTSRRTHAADFVTLLKRLPHYFSMHNALQTFLYFMPHSEALLAVVASVAIVVFFLLVAWPTHKPLKFL